MLISGIELGNEWFEEPTKVKRENEKVLWREKLTKTSGREWSKLDGINFKEDNRGNGLLIEKFEVEEIKAVVWECEGSKSLGV